MDLIEIINTLNNILQPHFYLVDEIYSDIRITNFEKLIGNNTLFWKLNGQNKKLINANKQNELLETVKQLNIGKAELCSLSGLGKYLVLNLQ
jgi:hypothetical protein